jgi:hypothetical protein
MQPTIDIPHSENKWVYATLTVFDGPRKLKPTQVSTDWVRFDQPPHLESKQIEIILMNGDAEHRQMAAVLPHDANATLIPIRLIRPGE